jgi:Family of unknown function (DUF5675)
VISLSLQHNRKDETGIYGELTNNGQLVCYTLEHAYSTPDGWQPKVPPGTYTCKRGQHCLEGGTNFITFEVQAVPGHSGILFHTGNLQGDSLGCILVGQEITGNVLLRSRLAFGQFMALLGNQPTFTLTVL